MPILAGAEFAWDFFNQEVPKGGLAPAGADTIPMVTNPKTLAMATTGTQDIPQEQPRCAVLVVDDEPVVATELAAGLCDMGYAAEHALSADEAMEILAARPDIGVLVTDIRMSGTDGFALARMAVARRDRATMLAVVLITGHATPEDLADAMPAGGAELVRKPFLLKEIGAAIARARQRAAQGSAAGDG